MSEVLWIGVAPKVGIGKGDYTFTVTTAKAKKLQNVATLKVNAGEEAYSPAVLMPIAMSWSLILVGITQPTDITIEISADGKTFVPHTQYNGINGDFIIPNDEVSGEWNYFRVKLKNNGSAEEEVSIKLVYIE